jgi:hypothetical protein
VKAEAQPAPRRSANYLGDQRHVLHTGVASWVGPDRRGVLWRPCHAEYNADSDRTTVIFKPVPQDELDELTQRVKKVTEC